MAWVSAHGQQRLGIMRKKTTTLAEQYATVHEALAFNSRMGCLNRMRFSSWPSVLEWLDSEIDAAATASSTGPWSSGCSLTATDSSTAKAASS